MKHIGLLHPSVNAINFISGFMINVNKKKSFHLFYIHFLLLYYSLLFVKGIYPFYIYTDKYKINKLLIYKISVFIYKMTLLFSSIVPDC